VSERQRGPVRSEASRRAILDATARLFAAVGYDRLTIEGIAAEAHVGKQTIYRWWGAKSALVAECLLEGKLGSNSLVPVDTGDIRADLADWLREVLAFVDDPANTTMVRSFMAAAIDNEDVGRRLGEAFGAGSQLHDRLRRAVEAGQLPASTPLPEFAKALVGVAIIHGLERAPAPPDLADRFVAGLLPPV
jgi:AcrR family transcriptional regulator